MILRIKYVYLFLIINAFQAAYNIYLNFISYINKQWLLTIEYQDVRWIGFYLFDESYIISIFDKFLFRLNVVALFGRIYLNFLQINLIDFLKNYNLCFHFFFVLLIIVDNSWIRNNIIFTWKDKFIFEIFYIINHYYLFFIIS